mmetsp:Transcript_34027/g.62611  ORF Transcript_34027/g.62611 Transcript_34027/m.62611 type:complete len:685 (-) Transcript_34027:237-2291(-)
MMSTMTLSPPPHTIKTRANSSDDYYGNTDATDFDCPLQRAASSEAQLPSYHSGSLSISSDDDIYNSGTSQHENNYHYNTLQHHDSFNHSSTKPQQPLPAAAQITRAKSDSSHNDSSTTTKSRLLQTTPHSGMKRLQTIESGIALAQQDPTVGGASSSPPKRHTSMIQQQHHSPQCQSPHTGNLETTSPQGNASPLLPPRHLLPSSDYSYYSVDAGKHGFLNQHHPIVHSNDNDSDVGSIDGNSSNGSLVFKYLPGEETPPAEYALPASILRVYGVECDEAAPTFSTENGNRIQWHRTEREGSCVSNGSRSSIVFDVEHGIDGTNESPNEARNDKDTIKRGSPPNNLSSLRDLSPKRILPYHERKRLMELEEEKEKKLKKNASKNSARMQQQSKMNKMRGRGQRRGSPKEDELTPLTGRQSDKGCDANGYGTGNNNNDQLSSTPNTAWFGQLVAIVTGKSDHNEPQQKQEEQVRGRIQDETQSYRDRGRAFLEKTEKEREKRMEQSRMEELNNVTIPVAKQSFGGHSRAKMSSMSNALDSIVSCSDDESSDEESGSSYYFDNDDDTRRQQGKNKVASTTTTNTDRVWKYGESPTNHPKTLTKKTTPPKKKKKKTPSSISSKQHDRIMKRERLLQEEYEYRLHLLKNENEKLSWTFRVFVLVTVAVIVAGALAFAFVVCVRMLLSI